MPSRRRIWCETVAPAELAAPATLALLRRFGTAPILAVRPDTVAAVRAAVRCCAGEGLAVAVWPMLADADGRWCSAANADRFAAFAERVTDALAPAEVVVDLEPPIEGLRETLASRSVSARVLPPGPSPGAYREAVTRLRALARSLHARGVAVSAAVALPVLFDGWEARLGTPATGLPWDHVSAMLYTSMVEGWSRGLLSRPDAVAVLHASCRALARRYGARAGASLGAVGPGAFGDEPSYRSPAELAADVAAAEAAGVSDLALFELGGVLRRPPAEAWLEAFVAPPAAAPACAPTWRARAALAAIRLAGGAFGTLAAARRGSGR